MRLDREVILDGALTLAAKEGFSRMTLRRLGGVLGADHTALYRHFRSKDELLMAMADRLLGNAPEVDFDRPWRDELREQIRFAAHRYFVHPDLAILLARLPYSSPGQRRVTESLLQLLEIAGLDDQSAAEMYHLIENHVIGAGLFASVVTYGDNPTGFNSAAERRIYSRLDPGVFPRLVRAAPYLFPDQSETFERTTTLLLNEIERLAQQGPAVAQ